MMKPQSPRNAGGMSLATTLAIGTASILWVAAMAGSIMPAYQQVSLTKCKSIARTCAETAVDIVIADLNKNFNGATGVSGSQYDASSLGGTTTRDLIIDSVPGVTPTVTVTVYNRFPGGATEGSNFSTVYDATLAAAPSAEKAKYYRIIEARCKFGVCEKRVRAVLSPMFSTGNNIVFPFAAFGDKGMTMVGRVVADSYNANEAADPLKDRLNAHMGSNTNTGHVGSNTYNNVSIGGNQYEFPAAAADQNAALANMSSQFNTSVQSKAKWVQYYGSVYSNGSNTAHWPAQPNDFVSGASNTQLTPSEGLGNHLQPDLQDGSAGQGIDNVRGLNNTYPSSSPDAGKWLPQPSDVNAPIDANGTGGVYASPNADGATLTNRAVETMMDYKKVTMVPAPSAPSGSIDLGAINLSQDAQVIFRSGASAPAGGFNIGSRSSGTVVLPSGNYTAPLISLSNSAKIVVESGNVNLYLEGGSSSTMVSVAKSASINVGSTTRASGLKMFTNKNSDVIINGSTKAVIYAPNARIFIGSGNNGQSSGNYQMTNPDGSVLDLNQTGSGLTNLDYWGAVVGRDTYLLAHPNENQSQVRFHYDRSLLPHNYQFRVRPNGGEAPSFGGRTFSGWKAISYQEDAPVIQ
jgi:hypothetical protein